MMFWLGDGLQMSLRRLSWFERIFCAASVREPWLCSPATPDAICAAPPPENACLSSPHVGVLRPMPLDCGVPRGGDMGPKAFKTGYGLLGLMADIPPCAGENILLGAPLIGLGGAQRR